MIPKLRSLAKDDANAPGEGVAIAPGDLTQDGGVTLTGVQDSGEHFDGGGFACAVGTNEGDRLSGGDVQADLIHGGDVGVLALFAPAATEGEVFAEAIEMNGGHDGILNPYFNILQL
jgi:hypothetical protein